MAFETVLLERHGHIGKLILNRPEKLNALNRQMEDEIAEAIRQVSADDSVRVLILTGAGRGFCSGADVSGLPGGGRPAEEWGRSTDDIRRNFRGAQSVVLGLQRLEKPTIGMVNGVAAGGGMDVACACDLRMGSPNTRFRSSFIKIGLFPGWGGTWLYPRLMGLPKAAEYLFTGDFIEAEEAFRIGLLNKLVPAEELEKATMEMAQKIANGPPIALRLAKLSLYKGLGMDLETAMQMAAACETITLTSEDHREGIAAFREKREPDFKGR